MKTTKFTVQLPVFSFKRAWDIQLLEWVRCMRMFNQQQLSRVGFWNKADKAKLEGYIHAFDMMEKEILKVKFFTDPKLSNENIK